MRFGKCDAEFMVSSNHCARTCGRAPFPSVDVICRTISESVEGSQLLDFLDIVLEMTDLKVAFDDPALHVTVFAPTNVAFEELLKDLCIGADEFLDFPGVVEEVRVLAVFHGRFALHLMDGIDSRCPCLNRASSVVRL